MKNIALKILTILTFFPGIVFAQSTDRTGIGQAFSNVKEVAKMGSYSDTISINTIAGDLIQLALSVLGVLFVIFMIYAGYLWLTAAGNEQRVERAKKILFESIIGLVIVVAAYAITYFIIYVFKGQVNL